jgi:putative ATPase
LDEIIGQDSLLSPNAPFRKALEAGNFRSAILWGPPGVGKSTLARCIASMGKYRFIPLSAVLSGVKELKAVIENRPALDPRKLLIFVDEIHRWNKAQQDALLPYVESGEILLLGATTENPAFYLTPALRSRTEILALSSIPESAILGLLQRALSDCERGLGGKIVEEGLLERIAKMADGDARRALGILERLNDRDLLNLEGLKTVGISILHDRSGDAHYDVVSALIKSIRASNPDAGVYWLARMLEGGEDPMFIARRLVISASEDIGNADPRALPLAVATLQGIEKIGMPEARILLSQCVTFLATCPKSNASYVAINAAIQEVRQSRALSVPAALRNAPTELARSLGHGEDYRYPHDFPDQIVEQECLPEGIGQRKFYQPVSSGYEKTIRERLEWWEARLKQRKEE